MFGAEVGASGVPVSLEVALAGAIPDQVQAHVDCLRPFMLNGVIYKTNCCSVINLHGCGGLGMYNFFECREDWLCVLDV